MGIAIVILAVSIFVTGLKRGVAYHWPAVSPHEANVPQLAAHSSDNMTGGLVRIAWYDDVHTP